MTLWRVEVHFDSPSVIGTADGTTTFPVQAGRALIVGDNEASYAAREFLGATVDMDGVYHYESAADGALLVAYNPVTFEMDNFEDPFSWNFAPPQAAGPVTSIGSGSFLSPGTLAIEKDYPNDALRFISPMGTLSASLHDLAARYPGNITPDDSPLVFTGIGHHFVIGVYDLSGPLPNQSETNLWFNMAVLRDGVPIYQVAMTVGDPLVFNPIFGGQAFVNTYDIQRATRFQTQNVLVGPEPGGFGADNFDVASSSVPFFGPLDCCPAWPHRWVLCAFCDYSGALYFRKSDDNGHTWNYQYITRPAQCLSPTIQWLEGLVAILYDDGTQIQKVLSQDYGLTWSTPMPVPITGTNPRLIIAPDSTWYYFYWASGGIQLQRSVDGGVTLFDGTPISVANTVPQQDFAAVISSDGYLVVAYSDNSSRWQTVESQDNGLTWAAA